MIAKIIIGYFAIIGVVDTLVSILVLAFPKSRATKFVCKNFGVKYNTKTYEVID